MLSFLLASTALAISPDAPVINIDLPKEWKDYINTDDSKAYSVQECHNVIHAIIPEIALGAMAGMCVSPELAVTKVDSTCHFACVKKNPNAPKGTPPEVNFMTEEGDLNPEHCKPCVESANYIVPEYQSAVMESVKCDGCATVFLVAEATAELLAYPLDRWTGEASERCISHLIAETDKVDEACGKDQPTPTTGPKGSGDQGPASTQPGARAIAEQAVTFIDQAVQAGEETTPSPTGPDGSTAATTTAAPGQRFYHRVGGQVFLGTVDRVAPAPAVDEARLVELGFMKLTDIEAGMASP